MKRKLLIGLCVAAIGLVHITPLQAAPGDEAGAMIADVVVARPACFAATIIGTAFFVVSLPFSLASNRVNKAADALVITPAKATFTRPLGDLNALKD